MQDLYQSEPPNNRAVAKRRHPVCQAAHTSPRPQDRHDREGLLYSPGEEAEAQQG